MIPFFLKSAHLISSRKTVSRFFLWALLLLAFTGQAAWKKVYSFDRDWLVYQEAWKSFLPYVSSKHYAYHSKSLEIHPGDFPKAYLAIYPSENYHLFLQGTLFKTLRKGEVYRIPMDSLAKEDKLVLTVYLEDLQGLPSDFKVERDEKVVVAEKADFFSLQTRSGAPFSNFFLLSILSLMTCLGLLFAAYPRVFTSFYRYSDWIRWEVKDEVWMRRPFALPNVLVLFTLSLLTSCLAYLVGFKTIQKDEFFSNGDNFVALWPSLFFIFSKLGLSFLLFISRYFVYYLFTDLFKLKGLANVHYFKSLQTNLQFFTLLFASICFFAVYVGPSKSIDFSSVLYLVDGYFLFRFVYFFQSFQRSFSFPRLFLFIYLLIIEGQIILFGIRELIFPTYI
ncbi:MAG: hypothetical protein RJB49_899 [Bacteroidota bacterium]|jgi:hypothetical protein